MQQILSFKNHMAPIFWERNSLGCLGGNLYFKSFWVVRSGANCSWYWRKILNLRSLVMIAYAVGNGEMFFMRHDHWHPKELLLLTYGSRLVLSGMHMDIKLSVVIHDAQWNWPTTQSEVF